MTDIAFAAPRQLWLLLAPAALLLLWVWRFAARRADVRRILRRRIVPLRERFRVAGDLGFWLCLLPAIALLYAAAARPVAPSSVPRRPGIDIVVLQDASASMRVGDVVIRAGIDGGAERRAVGDRWQRSMMFLRALGDALSWHEDRIAMAVFAHIATPQIRLTRDPNTLFFFLDHLHGRPPFRLEDDTTWDTNLEAGIAWGLRIVDKDDEIHGRSANARMFLMISDGESWSGEVAKAIARARERGIPLHVIGVGTLSGGPLPAVTLANGEVAPSPGVSRLDRASLQRIASAGNGRYFELGRDGDRYIANTVVAAGRRLAPSPGVEETADELYWWFLCAAAAFAALGALLLREPLEPALILASGVVAAVIIGPLLW